jgi:hypothetical protein
MAQPFRQFSLSSLLAVSIVVFLLVVVWCERVQIAELESKLDSVRVPLQAEMDRLVLLKRQNETALDKALVDLDVAGKVAHQQYPGFSFSMDTRHQHAAVERCRANIAQCEKGIEEISVKLEKLR